MVTPAFITSSTVASLPPARTRSDSSNGPIYGPSVVAIAITTVRFRVPGPVILMVTTAGTGKGVENGTSTKDVESSEIVCKANVTASDKIGISIEGCFMAIDTLDLSS